MNAVEIRLFQDLRRSNALKAWLVLYRFGLQDPLLRTLLKTGCQPWEEDIVNANSILFAPRSGIDFWKYQEDFCHPPARQLTSYEAGYEMKSYFKYFVTCTLNGDSFEVFDTDGMGLGIRATQLVSFGAISLELCGFMEIISYHLYSWLKENRYPSLYHWYDQLNNEFVYGILYGPLSLVNTGPNVDFGFMHWNISGTHSCWRFTYKFGQITEDLGDGVLTWYDRHVLIVEDTEENADGVEAPIEMDDRDTFVDVHVNFALREKVHYVPRIHAFHPSTYAFIHKYYFVNEEILLHYVLNVDT